MKIKPNENYEYASFPGMKLKRNKVYQAVPANNIPRPGAIFVQDKSLPAAFLLENGEYSIISR